MKTLAIILLFLAGCATDKPAPQPTPVPTPPSTRTDAQVIASMTTTNADSVSIEWIETNVGTTADGQEVLIGLGSDGNVKYRKVFTGNLPTAKKKATKKR